MDMPKINKENIEKLCSALKTVNPEEFTKIQSIHQQLWVSEKYMII